MPDARSQLQAYLDSYVRDRGRLRVLEAGCGSATHVDLGDHVYMVGVDIEQAQLDRNTRLDEKIRADLQTYKLPDETFDIIICWDVLEHLSDPDKVLASFQTAVKPDGLIVIAVPNLYSIKGLVTRFTPHWFHIFIYRHVYGSQTAGKPGHGPFPTYLRRSIAPGALRRVFRDAGMAEELFELYPSTLITRLGQRSRVAYLFYRAAVIATAAAFFGRYDGNNSDLIAVYRKATHATSGRAPKRL